MLKSCQTLIAEAKALRTQERDCLRREVQANGNELKSLLRQKASRLAQDVEELLSAVSVLERAARERAEEEKRFPTKHTKHTKREEKISAQRAQRGTQKAQKRGAPK
jgi:hypothetical protein